MAKQAGGFNFEAFGSDVELITKGELQQLAVIEIDVGAVGKEFIVNLPMACNAFSLVNAVVDDQGNIQASSAVARFSLRFNDRNNKGVVFSWGGATDLKSFSGTITKIYCRVVTADVGQKVYAVAMLASGVSTLGSASGYNPPASQLSGGGGGRQF